MTDNLIQGKTGSASLQFCMASSTGIDPTCFLHKRPQLTVGHFATGDIPQCSCPFADCLAIGVVATGAANDGSEWICVLVKRKTSEFERMPQKSFGPPPHPVVHDYLEHSAQISIHGIASAACLKIIPGTTNPLKPSHEPSFWGFVFTLAKWMANLRSRP
jgi:hypothetical protein